MSYGITPYMVNLDTVNRCHGGLDDSTKSAVLSACKNQFDNIDDSFEQDDGWELGYAILEKILNGDSFSGIDNTTKHWYVTEFLVLGFGERLSNDEWYSGRCSAFWGIDQFKLYGLELGFRTPDDFPVVFSIKNADLDDAYKALLESDETTQPQKEQFRKWVDEATSNQRDLVLFYY